MATSASPSMEPDTLIIGCRAVPLLHSAEAVTCPKESKGFGSGFMVLGFGLGLGLGLGPCFRVLGLEFKVWGSRAIG